MNISILTNLYPPFIRGGAEYLTHQLVQELVRQKHSVSVITTAPWKSVKWWRTELSDEGGVRVYRFYPPNFYHYLSAARVPYPLRFIWHLVNLFNFMAARKLKHILKREQPELVVSANLMGLSFWTPRVVNRLGIRHIHILHDVQLLHPSGLFLLGQHDVGWGAKFYQLLTRWLFSSVSIIISPSHWLIDEHQRRGFFKKAKVVCLPNPVPPSVVVPTIKTTKAPLNLLYVGQIEEHKGIIWLIEAIKNLSRQDFQLHLYVLGQKPKLRVVKDLINNDHRFVLHDLPSQQEIDEAYSSSHLALVPSLCYENSPVAIPRAFAAGTPVLASRIGGIPELVRVGDTGWLFIAGNNQDLITKLEWCLDHPGDLLKAGLTASREFADRTLEHYAQEIAKLAALN